MLRNFTILTVFVMLTTAFLAANVLGQVDCSQLDPRSSVSTEKDGKIKASVDTLYKIAKAGGSVEGRVREEIQNLQKGVPITETGLIKLRTLALFCGMVANAKDISTERKVELYKVMMDVKAKADPRPKGPVQKRESKAQPTNVNTPNTERYVAVPQDNLLPAPKTNNLSVPPRKSSEAPSTTTSTVRQPEAMQGPVVYSFPNSYWKWGGDSGCGSCPLEKIGRNGISVTLKKSSETGEDIQLHQGSISVVQNQRYLLRLSGSSDKEVAVGVGLYERKTYDPLHKPGQIRLYLSPEKREFSEELRINGTTNNAEFAFYLGGLPNGTRITFHEIQLLRINDENQLITPTRIDNGSSEVGQRSAKSGEPELIKRDGKDVLIHEKITDIIRDYNPSQPVYIAWGEPAGCGPLGNGWLQSPQVDATKYVLKKEGDYFRATGMVSWQFQIVQLKNNRGGYENVRWALLERKAHELGDYYFNGFDCQGSQRSAIWVKK